MMAMKVYTVTFKTTPHDFDPSTGRSFTVVAAEDAEQAINIAINAAEEDGYDGWDWGNVVAAEESIESAGVIAAG
jgi:hypothetical protein